ncbi:MAG: DUF1016 family protein [Muribaculaceae bacterium]|nr:DUF1016 family protein [Muribaculaceae bacterium]
MKKDDDELEGMEQQPAEDNIQDDQANDNDASTADGGEGAEPEAHSSYQVPKDKKLQLSGMYENWFLDYASYVILERARYWYVREASSQSWSVRTLARNVGSQYYHRLLQSPRKEVVINEMLQITEQLKNEPQDFLKDPIVAEFLQLTTNASFTETELEKAIIRHLKEFLLELGRGFAFMAEQYHISTDGGDFFVDLVFYNVVLKCYVLIDLKTKKLTHQDVGQMDMYVRMFDDLKRTEGDNPTIGLLLCSDTSKDIAKYSVLHDSKQLFAAKYLTYLPTEEVLRREIEQQKELFYLQHKKIDNQ